MKDAGESLDRFLWQLSAGNRRSTLEDAPRGAGRNERVNSDEQGARRARLSLCGADDLLPFMQAVGMVNDHVVTSTAMPAYFARSRYCPERGSTRTFSPG